MPPALGVGATRQTVVALGTQFSVQISYFALAVLIDVDLALSRFIAWLYFVVQQAPHY